MLVTTISIELTGINRYEYVVAKQGDNESRVVQIELLNNGRIYVLDNLTKARALIKKPDKTEVLTDCTINRNVIELVLTNNILACAGTGSVEIILTHSSMGYVLTSAEFDLKIVASGSTKGAESSTEYLSLKEGLKKLDDVATVKQISELTARINNLASLEEGSTTGDAELQDIRIGIDGKRYESAGTAVREQINKIYDDMDNMQVNTEGYVDFYKTAEIVQSMYNPANGVEYKGGISSIYRNLEVGKWYAYPCNSYSGYLGCLFYDKNENYISGIVATKDRTVYGCMKFKVPENTEKTIISMEWMDTSVVEGFRLFEVNDDVEFGVEYISGIDGKSIVDMNIFKRMKKVNLLSDDDVTIGKMVAGSGAESNSAGRNLYTIQCNELTNYTINYDPADMQCMFFFYDNTGNVIGGLSHIFGNEDLGSEINFGNVGVGRILTTVTKKTINGVTHNLQTFTTPFGARIMKLTTAASLRGEIVCVKGTAEDWISNGYKFEDTHKIAKPYADKVIYTLGDSITAGTNGGYQRYIRDITGASIVNYAYSGLTATSLVDKVCTDNIDFTRASAVTIMIGTNGGVGNSTVNDIPYIIGGVAADVEAGNTLTYNNMSISTIDAYWALFNTLKYHSAVAKIIEWVQWKNSDCKIYLLTPLPNAFRGLTLDGGHESIRKALFELNRLYSTNVIDLVRESGVCIHNITEYTYDNTHYNEKGNEAVGTYVGYKLNSR